MRAGGWGEEERREENKGLELSLYHEIINLQITLNKYQLNTCHEPHTELGPGHKVVMQSVSSEG